jgi:hypothetical protein
MAATFPDSLFERLGLVLGRFDGLSGVVKFGHAPDGIQTTPTDVWDRADAAVTQQIWVPPTAPRVHQLSSTDADDTAAGAGAQTVRVWGLPSWGARETVQDIPMAGLGNAPTTPLVMINRQQVIGPNNNQGTITATADTDGTITSLILPANGQTQQAIYGWPSGQSLALLGFYGAVIRAAQAVNVEVDLLYAPTPDTGPWYRQIHHDGLESTGTSAHPHEFSLPKLLEGPGILKLQCVSSSLDTNVGAGFDAILVDV